MPRGWVPANSVLVSVTTASQAIAIPFVQDERKLRVQNDGDVTIAYEFGASGVVVVNPTGTPSTNHTVQKQMVEILEIPEAVTHIAIKTISGTATVYITTGHGD